MKRIIVLLLSIAILSCSRGASKTENKGTSQVEIIVKPKLDIKQANILVNLPLACVKNEYPNKLSQTLSSALDLKTPTTLHPAFYGCFDWHSAVHGHWSLVYLLKNFPELDRANEIKQYLLINISKENIEIETKYFEGKHNKNFERTYGWAWLLKLTEEIHTWDNDTARILEKNLEPLADLICEKYIAYLPKLNYAQRVGTHSNTAFGLSFAYDYALTFNRQDLQNTIKERAKSFFMSDKQCPMGWEPSGSDFLSPCLEEAALMKRLLSKTDFKLWLNDFLPLLKNKDFQLETGKVSDRTDGHLVHLDGLNFSRAWCLNAISKGLPEYRHLQNIATTHINYTLPNIFEDSYEGGHWLGSFAIYALDSTLK